MSRSAWKQKEIERRVNREMNHCVHFTGVQHEECKAGVNYHAMLGSGVGCFAHIPCLADDGATIVCDKRQLPTEEEARATVEEHDKHIAEFLNQLAQGICQYCKVEVKQRQIGHCVYGSCGHRLYQGTVNPKFAGGSYVTEIENLRVLLAWEAGELSEGQAAKRLGLDRIDLRDMRIRVIAETVQ